MFVLSFANLKSCALSVDPLGDHVMPSATVRIRTQASRGNITVLSHLNCKLPTLIRSLSCLFTSQQTYGTCIRTFQLLLCLMEIWFVLISYISVATLTVSIPQSSAVGSRNNKPV